MFNNQRICMPFVRILAILFTIMWSGSMLFGQTRTVTGQVIDQATGEPVIGANVLVKGTTTGTITDLDGNFSISGVTDKSVLHVSFVGYTAEDVHVKGNTKLNIVIREDNDLLEEVVVVGYGVQKKRDLTGAISSVKADEIKVAPVMNAMEGLQGKIAGLDITRESGQAGQSPTLLLRGNRSLDGSNAPLFVIDCNIVEFVVDAFPGIKANGGFPQLSCPESPVQDDVHTAVQDFQRLPEQPGLNAGYVFIMFFARVRPEQRQHDFIHGQNNSSVFFPQLFRPG